MSQPLPPTSPRVAARAGWQVGGSAFMIGWVLIHVILFYAFAVSGFLVDLMLSIIKAIMFPGAGSYSTGGAHEMLAWEGHLRAGLILAGAAGFPGGLAMILPSLRKLLWLGFWLLLLAGLAYEISAFGILIDNAFRVRS